MQDRLEYKFLTSPRLNVGLVFERGKVVRSCVGHSGEREFYGTLRRLFPFAVKAATSKSLAVKKAEEAFRKYIAGEDVDLSRIPHRLPDETTELARSLYRELKKIKSGDLITYQELAEKVGLAGGARAVGNLVGKNPLPLLVPCHRVVGKASVGGFSAPGGLATKQKILSLEGVGLTHLSPISYFDRGMGRRDLARELELREPRLKAVIHNSAGFRPSGVKPQSPFLGLAKGIVYQQLSTQAARTIYDRLLKAQGRGDDLTFKWVNSQRLEDLTSHGVSGAKAKALKALAAAQIEGSLLSLDEAMALPDFMLRRRLSQISGVGPWTVEMYLIFSLGRLNVASPGDLGLRKGLARLNGQPDCGGRTAFLRNLLPWEPYRTIGAWYLWRSLEGYQYVSPGNAASRGNVLVP